jgi:hypothetical protein
MRQTIRFGLRDGPWRRGFWDRGRRPGGGWSIEHEWRSSRDGKKFALKGYPAIAVRGC